jgi:hypothetical protein
VLTLRLAFPTGCAAFAAVLAGCVAGPENCTSIGTAPSGVQLNVHRILSENPDTSLVLRACVGNECLAHRVGEAPRVWSGTNWTILDSNLSDATVPVRVLVQTDSGHEVFTGSIDVEPQLDQPNGVGCPPSAWRARVLISGEERMRQIPLQLG